MRDISDKLKSMPDAELISDYTLMDFGRHITGREDIMNAYDALQKKTFEQLETIVQPIISEIKNNGKIPVTIQVNLGDHLSKSLLDSEKMPGLISKHSKIPLPKWNGWSDEGRTEESRKLSQWYAVLFAEKGAKVITTDELPQNTLSDTNIIKFLKQQGMDPKKVVLLMDHHTTYPIRDKKSELGYDQLEIFFVCPCCMQEELIEKKLIEYGRGFKIAPIETKEYFQAAFDIFKEKIRERQK